jgi:CubicO group peptidase (beta-lactamase class C family)
MTALMTALMTAVVSACSDATSSPVDPSPVDRWAAVDSVASAHAARRTGASFALTIRDRRDSVVFERSYGGFDVDRRIAVASASKLVAAMLLLDVVASGELSLESTTGDVLGWTGQVGTITLQHLLSFTSGLQNENLCTFNPFSSLDACVRLIRDTPMLAPPGTRFDYGSTHLHVAARMAEVATGRSFDALFRERLTAPLALPADVQFYTLPNQSLGVANPLVAGGLRASAREYGVLLAAVFRDGRTSGASIATPSLFAAQSRAPYPSVDIGQSPYAGAPVPVRYGLGAWLECATPATGCDRISSAGAFGFTPWIDRAAGYYATLAMEDLGTGATVFSVELQQALLPFIEAALASR